MGTYLYSDPNNITSGNSLADQWLRIDAFTAMAWVQSLVREPRFHRLHDMTKYTYQTIYLEKKKVISNTTEEMWTITRYFLILRKYFICLLFGMIQLFVKYFYLLEINIELFIDVKIWCRICFKIIGGEDWWVEIK